MGIWIALGCAISWSISIICFRKVGENAHPYSINTFKNSFGLILCFVTLWVSGSLFTGFETWDALEWTLAAASGVLGIGIADALALYSLQKVGASRFAILECVYAPSVIIGSYVFFAETVNLLQMIGIILVLGAIVFVTFDQHSQPQTSLADNRTFWGILVGIFSILLMAIGILLVKPLFQTTELLNLVTLRLAAGAAFSYLLYFFTSRQTSPLLALVKAKTFTSLIVGSLFGTYISMLLWVGGFKYEQAAIIAVLNQTSTIFTIVMAYFFLGETLKRSQIAAIVMVILGVLCITATTA